MAGRIIRLGKDSSARIPFAYLALILFILTSFAGIARMDTEAIRNRGISEAGGSELDDYIGKIDVELEEKAYYYTMEIIRNVTRDTDPQLDQIQTRLEEKMKNYIESSFPREMGPFMIYIDGYEFKLSTEIMDTYDNVLDPEETYSDQPGPFYLNIKEPNTKVRYTEDLTRTAAYPRITGFIDFRGIDHRSGITITNRILVDRNIYVPLPLVKKGVDSMRFSFRDDRGFANIIIKYILNTIAQYRALTGIGGGGYADSVDGKGLDNIITHQDVELAVNIALILEMTRNFREYDIDIARAIDNAGYSGMWSSWTMEDLIRNYVNNGTVDGADIVALYYGYDNPSSQKIDVGKVMAQAIYSYADRFSYALYDLFWGHDASSQYHLVDPTLKSPIEDWNQVKAKGEDWAKQMVIIWMNKFREWLGVPEKIKEREASAQIPVMSVDYTMPHEPPEPSTAGTYYVFGGNGVPGGVWTGGRWYVKLEGVDDTMDLVLGDPNNNVEGHTMMVHPVKMTCHDDFSSTVGQKTYKYYPVKESLISKHSDNPGTAFMDTLEYIIKSLDKSMTQRRSSNTDDMQNAGLVDTIAKYAEDMSINQPNQIYIQPNDKATIIHDTTQELLLDTDGNDDAYYNFLKKFGNEAGDFSTRDKWFHDGAYHYGMDNSGKKDPDYLWALVKESVDLWYEMVLNIYWGGVQWETQQNPQEATPITQLPKETQIADGVTGPQNRDFKFRQDAMADLYYRIHKDIWQHGMQGSDRRNVWDQTHWRGTLNPVDIQAILALAKTRWSDINIWSSLLHDATWSDQIKDALDKTVGDNKGVSDPDDGEITKALKEYMDMTTDNGQYEDNGAFYRFVGDNVGSTIYVKPDVVSHDEEGNIINCMSRFVSNNLWQSGWLDRSVRGAMYYGIYDYADLWNSEYLSPSMKGVPFHLWHGNEADAKLNKSDMYDGLKVELTDSYDGTPHLLDEHGSEITELNVEYEKHSHRFADVQNEVLKDANGDNMYMCDAPFQRQWNISLKGSFTIDVSTKRSCLMVDGKYEPMHYKAKINLSSSFNIMLFTAWPMQSTWDSADGSYYFTRENFGFVGGGETFDHPNFISLPFNEFNRGIKTVTDFAVDAEYMLAPMITSFTDKGAEENVHIPEKFGFMDVDTLSDNYQDFMDNFNEILNDFMNVRSQVPQPPTGDYKYSFYGYPASVPSSQNQMHLLKEENPTGQQPMDYLIDFQGSILQITSKVRSDKFTFNYSLSPQNQAYHFEAGYDLNGDRSGGAYVFNLDYQNSYTNDVNFDPVQEFSNIYLKNPGMTMNIKVGFIHDGSSRAILDDAMSSADSSSVTDQETLISYLQDVLGYLYNKSNYQQLSSYGMFGLCFEIENYIGDWNLDNSLCLKSQKPISVSTDMVRYYLHWVINQMRPLVYNIGTADIDPYLIASSDGKNKDLWDNCGMYTRLYNDNASSANYGLGAEYYNNLVSNTMAVNEVGFEPTDIYMDMATYSSGDGRWVAKVT